MAHRRLTHVLARAPLRPTFAGIGAMATASSLKPCDAMEGEPPRCPTMSPASEEDPAYPARRGLIVTAAMFPTPPPTRLDLDKPARPGSDLYRSGSSPGELDVGDNPPDAWRIKWLPDSRALKLRAEPCCGTEARDSNTELWEAPLRSRGAGAFCFVGLAVEGRTVGLAVRGSTCTLWLLLILVVVAAAVAGSPPPRLAGDEIRRVDDCFTWAGEPVAAPWTLRKMPPAKLSPEVFRRCERTVGPPGRGRCRRRIVGG